MRRDLVQEQHRRRSLLLRPHSCRPQHQGDEKRLLLAGGTKRGGLPVTEMTNLQFAFMRPNGGPALGRIAAPRLGQGDPKLVFCCQRGAIAKPGFNRSVDLKGGGGKYASIGSQVQAKTACHIKRGGGKSDSGRSGSGLQNGQPLRFVGEIAG